MIAAAAALAIGTGTRSVLGAIAGGMATLYLALWIGLSTAAQGPDEAARERHRAFVRPRGGQKPLTTSITSTSTWSLHSAASFSWIASAVSCCSEAISPVSDFDRRDRLHLLGIVHQRVVAAGDLFRAALRERRRAGASQGL